MSTVFRKSALGSVVAAAALLSYCNALAAPTGGNFAPNITDFEKANYAQVCPGYLKGSAFFNADAAAGLNPLDVAIYYWQQKDVQPLFLTPKHLQTAFATPNWNGKFSDDPSSIASNVPGERIQVVTTILNQLVTILGNDNFVDAKGGARLHFSGNFSASDVALVSSIFLSPAGLVVDCPSAPAQPASGNRQTAAGNNSEGSGSEVQAPSSFSLANVRLRGSIDALAAQLSTGTSQIGASSVQQSASSSAAASATGASASYTGNNGAHSTSAAVEAALGYDFNKTYGPDQAGHVGTLYQTDLIPFFFADVNLATANGKASSSNRENLAGGLQGSVTTRPIGGNIDALVAALTYEHLWNEEDSSQLNFLHLSFTPYIDYLPSAIFDLNTKSAGTFLWAPKDTPPSGQIFFLTPQLTPLADLGSYNDRGTDPKANPNYAQIGGLVGLDLNILPLSSDFSVSETYMAELERSRPNIRLFQAAWTLNLSSAFGIKLSYQNGNLETTGQKTDQWLISLTAKQ